MESPKRTTFTFELNSDQQELLLGVMLTGNFRRREVPYSLWSIEGDRFNATLYEKERHGMRRLCVQGVGAEDFVLFTLEPRVLGGASLGYEGVLHPEATAPHAGSDESGKGDYYGPLVVCCVYVDEALVAAMQKFTYLDSRDRLQRLEIKDCKAYASDSQILAAGTALRKLLGPNGYSLVKFGPAAYNRLFAKMKNVNRMLAWAHATAIEELLTKRPACRRVVVDQFARMPKVDAAGRPVTDAKGHVCEDVERSQAVLKRALKERGRHADVEQRHRAESDIAVAAASVMAREQFLRDIQAMRDETGEDIPIGSSDPRVRGLSEAMVRAHGPLWLMNHCKAHFQTTDKVLTACGRSRADLPAEGQVVRTYDR